jgi:hypothetical protein
MFKLNKILILLKEKLKQFIDQLYSFIPVTFLEVENYRQPSKAGKKKACIFAAWDPHGLVDDYVLGYLDELIENGFDIYFCSTSQKKLQPDAIAQLKSRCVYFSRRRNLGLDFGSWKLCYLRLLDSHTYEELLITNDSVFGPIFPLAETFKKIDGKSEDIIGMTDNYERSHHLQSYFLLFRKKAFKDFLPDFFASVKIIRNKDVIIENYEVGLSKRLVAEGFSLGAVFPVDCTIEKVNQLELSPQSESLPAGFAVNSTTVFWNILIEHFRFPFLKREVITKRVVPGKLVDHWVLFLETYNVALVKKIRGYLDRLS